MDVSRPAALSRLHVLLPLRGLADGKERLGHALDAEERETLIVGMLLATLDQILGWAAVRAVHVISADETVLAIAAARGAEPLGEGSAAGLNAALLAGRREAVAANANAVLCLPADLPLLTRQSLDQLLDAGDAAIAAGNGRAAVVLAPSDVGGGTNALLLSPPEVIEPAFGGASLEAHCRAAARADASLQLVVDPALGFDLDTPEDLERLDASRLVDLLRLGSEALAASGR